MGPLRILVTDGDTRAALAVTRSLGRLGHEIIVGARGEQALAQASKYCSRRVSYPDPEHHEQEFLETLETAVRDLEVDVLMPVADVATILITSQRARFEPYCKIPCADAEAILSAADKAAMVRIAETLGIPVPRSWIVNAQADPVESDIPFPIVIKPHRSRIRTPDGWRSCSVSYAADRTTLAADLARRHASEFPIILQERIVGPGVGCFLCIDRNVVTGVFSHRRLREKPPWGGVSVLSQSTAVEPTAREYGERLLRAIGWQGVAMVEFKVDLRTNVPMLMEINGRFWGSLQLAIDAGVDFPALLIETLELGAPRLPVDYRVGVKNRWFWGDVDSLLLQLFGKRGRGEHGRLRAVFEFLKFWEPDLHYENPRLSDLGPWWNETARRLKRNP